MCTSERDRKMDKFTVEYYSLYFEGYVITVNSLERWQGENDCSQNHIQKYPEAFHQVLFNPKKLTDVLSWFSITRSGPN